MPTYIFELNNTCRRARSGGLLPGTMEGAISQRIVSHKRNIGTTASEIVMEINCMNEANVLDQNEQR